MFQKICWQALNVLIPSQTFSACFISSHLLAEYSIRSRIYSQPYSLLNMRFTAITLLALGASATAYVVNDKKVVADNAVEARVVVSQITIWLWRSS